MAATTETFNASASWQNLNTLTGFPVGSEIIVNNQGRAGDYLMFASAATEPARDFKGHSVAADEPVILYDELLPIWVRFVRHGQGAGILGNGTLTFTAEIRTSLLVTPLSGLDQLITSQGREFQRLKVQTFTVTEQFIVNGVGFAMEWDEYAIPPGGFRYVEFTIPPGFFLALESRELNAEFDHVYYRSYKEGSYTIDTIGADVDNHNLRSDSAFTPSTVKRATVTANPDINDHIAQVKAFGAVGSGNRSSGEVLSANVFRLFAPDTKYLLQIENDGSNATDVIMTLVYGLIPEDSVPPALV